MNPLWATDMADLVDLFIKRGLIRRPRPMTAEQAMAMHRLAQREHSAEIKRAYRAKRKNTK